MDSAFIHDLFAGFGLVSVRRMFGGAGLFVDGLMFGLVTRDVIYLKSDESTQPAFVAERCGPFTYDTKTGERVLTSYWRMPERLYDDADELAAWARQALAVARRKASGAKGTGKRIAAPKPAAKRVEKGVKRKKKAKRKTRR